MSQGELLLKWAEAQQQRPALWTPAGVEPLVRRMERLLPRLPSPLAARARDTLAEVTDAFAGDAISDSHGGLRARFLASQRLELLLMEATNCPPPGESWQRPGWIVSVKLVETERIGHSVRMSLIRRAFARIDAVGRETEKRCDWFWEKCSPGSTLPPPQVRPWDTARESYELIREDPDA